MPIGRDATASLATLSTSPSNSEASEVSILDSVFCQHGKEQCIECGADYREDNSLTYGLDFMESREPLEVDFTYNKDGEPICKKHKAKDCSHFSFKKLIQKANTSAKKHGGK